MGRAFEYRKAAKMKRWGNMSKVFPKLARAITIAAKEGGTDPYLNSKLRTAILNAKSENMPKDNIDAAIKRALGKDAEEMYEVSYEGKGPHGVLIIVDCLTNNTTRTVANVKSYFNKCNGQLLPNGSLDFMFKRQAVFEFKKPSNMDLEELELSLIDAGLESMEVDEDTIYVYGDYTSFGTLNQAFEDLKIDITKANLQRIANSPLEFSDEELVEIDKLIEKIEDDEDVQDVFTNIA
ncbi:MAG: YebC/PmpR family DNA-binding transcriptional regulator [Campylobacterales bacterium]|nr:YebC/PmpR family DNA-binding transcriptional regulator [Campylobacterales bacterium]